MFTRKGTGRPPAGGQADSSAPRIHIGWRQALSMVYSYASKRVVEQLRSVSFIVAFLVIVQVFVLRRPILGAAAVAAGIAAVVVGLAFFMEGLFLGVMPMGEWCGLHLPGKLPLPLILLFALLLGVVATYAEPAILALRGAGGHVDPWAAPLLFLLLNTRPELLLLAISVGVGLAVVLSMVRFLRQWSLKPLLATVVPLLLALTAYAYFDPNLRSLTALAWDTGGLTTGPVTVPLVIALGLGVSRMVGGDQRHVSGLGAVTLASLLPILTVLTLGLVLGRGLPPPMSEAEFFRPETKERVVPLFGGEGGLKAYSLRHRSVDDSLYLFEGDRQGVIEFLVETGGDPGLLERYFGGLEAFRAVLDRELAPFERRLVIWRTGGLSGSEAGARAGSLILRNARLALQAILPLTLLLVFVILVVLRVLPGKLDEFFLGVAFSLIGLFLFSVGIEIGISRLGEETGRSLPTTFREISVPEETRVIRPFSPEMLWPAATLEGGQAQYFFLESDSKVLVQPFDAEAYDPEARTYTYVPRRGPLVDPGRWPAGLLLALLLAFVVGYGATLAEPALNSLGRTLEEISVGTFKRSFLVQTVAGGVGFGIACGFARIVWDIPLAWFLVPIYLGLVILSLLAEEGYVNIAWDSAGVTTGPITVPLVIALGLGIGGQIGVAESFGMISLASAFPILSVLAAGQYVEWRRRRRLRRA